MTTTTQATSSISIVTGEVNSASTGSLATSVSGTPTSITIPQIRDSSGDSTDSAPIPDSAPIRVDRDPMTGRFLPGNLANPGGRPKTKLLSQAYKRILEEQGADAFAEVIAKDAQTAPRAHERLAAAQEMADRTEGRPVQASLVGVASIDGDTAKRIAELMELLGPAQTSV